jgi:hypothetical protein
MRQIFKAGQVAERRPCPAWKPVTGPVSRLNRFLLFFDFQLKNLPLSLFFVSRLPRPVDIISYQFALFLNRLSSQSVRIKNCPR